MREPICPLLDEFLASRGRDEMRDYIEWQRQAVEDARRHAENLRNAIINFTNSEHTAHGKAND